MKSVEQIYALFVEANPVMDLDDLDCAAAAGPLHLVRDDDRNEAPFQPLRRRPVSTRWRPALMGAALAVLVGVASAGVFWAVAVSGGPAAAGSSIHVSFDGAACAFAGPGEVSAGEVLLVAERSWGAEDVAVVVIELVDPSITLDEIRDWADGQSARRTPPFAGESMQHTFLAEDDIVLTVPLTLERGRYVVTCNTAPEGTDRAHPAAIVTVAARR